MATDKEIRKFIQDNMPEVKDNDRFMEDLVRQINLLPTPYPLSGRSDEDIQQARTAVLRIVSELKRRYRRNAILSAAAISGILAVAMGTLYIVPSLRDFALEYTLYLCVGFSAVLLLAVFGSLRRVLW